MNNLHWISGHGIIVPILYNLEVIMSNFTYLLFAVVALLSFYAGACVGIKDCKRKFGIPKSAVGVDEDGYIYP